MNTWGTNDKFTFLVDWFDPHSSMTRKFHLSWFPYDETIELFDIQLKRTFLKRIKIEKLTLDDIFVGNLITIFSRQLKITAYANEYTKKMIGQTLQKVVVFIKSDGIQHKAEIIQKFVKSGFKICNLKMLNLLKEQVDEIFEDEKDNPQLNFIIGPFLAGPVLALDMVAEDGQKTLKNLVGPEDPEVAKSEAPSSIRALFGKDKRNNAVYYPDTPEKLKRCLDVAFRKPTFDQVTAMSTAVLEDSTCCIVKPHAIRAGHLGDILLMIEENGYKITAMQMFFLDHINAGEFLEVYNGVTPEFPGMVREFLTGGCVAMEITGPMKEETPIEFRKLVGPSDPDIARQLRPDTIRAKFGISSVENGVHVTDLLEDAILEVEYFFRILQL